MLCWISPCWFSPFLPSIWWEYQWCLLVWFFFSPENEIEKGKGKINFYWILENTRFQSRSVTKDFFFLEVWIIKMSKFAHELPTFVQKTLQGSQHELRSRDFRKWIHIQLHRWTPNYDETSSNPQNIMSELCKGNYAQIWIWV